VANDLVSYLYIICNWILLCITSENECIKVMCFLNAVKALVFTVFCPVESVQLCQHCNTTTRSKVQLRHRSNQTRSASLVTVGV